MKAKVITTIIALAVTTIVPAYADVYVAVDKDGNVVSGAIMCDAVTCAAGSDYSKATLQDGQHYVLQNNGYAGIGNNNPDVTVKINETTNIWTVTTPSTTQQYQKTIDNPIVNTVINTAVDTKTAQVDTATVVIDSATVTSTTNNVDILATIIALLNKIFALLSLLGIKG